MEIPVLFIIRTPLQAWIAESIRAREQIDVFDCVYVTLQNSREDANAFRSVRDNARDAWYVTLNSRRFDIQLQMEIAARLRKIIRRGEHDWNRIYLASYDCHGINACALRLRLPIITFDDGTANFTSTSSYGYGAASFRERLYRRLLGGKCNRDFVERVIKHYTIFSFEKHLIPRSKLVLLSGPTTRAKHGSNSVVRYFIGAPFSEVLSPDAVERLRSAAAGAHVDRYVPHPRERKRLQLGDHVELLEKHGEIAELAIERDANNQEIWLYGWYSTVMFTMRPVAVRRVMFLLRDDVATDERSRHARDAGCEVVLI